MENESNEKAQPEQTTMLEIVIDKNGNLGVRGPILADKTACYGILESAKDIVRDMYQPKLVKPSGGLIQHLRNGRN